MEGQPDLGRHGAGGAQQLHRIGHGGAELAGQVVDGIALRQRQAHDEAEVGGVIRLLQDFVQLLAAVEHEVADAILVIGVADRLTALDRVHVMQDGVREHLADQPDLAGGGDVEMAHAAGPQGTQHRGLRVALHGIEHVAAARGGIRRLGEGGQEAAGGVGQHAGADAVHRLFRAVQGDGLRHRRTAAAGQRNGAAVVQADAAQRGDGGTGTQEAHGALLSPDGGVQTGPVSRRRSPAAPRAVPAQGCGTGGAAESAIDRKRERGRRKKPVRAAAPGCEAPGNSASFTG